jgi:FMN phosphatase YigB (HAD superfamily)
VRELERVGVLGLFESLVFSSDHRSIKPSPVLFDIALRLVASLAVARCLPSGDHDTEVTMRG